MGFDTGTCIHQDDLIPFKFRAVLSPLLLVTLTMKSVAYLLALLSASALAKPVHRARTIKSQYHSSNVRRQYMGNSTANQLVDGTPCRDVTLIFARGTFEGGNIGAVVGPEFAQQLVTDLSVDQVAVQGVRWSCYISTG